MSALEIACPHCDTRLKIPDRSYLGKKARCAKCKNAFVLQEPDDSDEVAMEVVASPPVAATAVGAMLGRDARWVPDDAPATMSAPAAPEGWPAPSATRPTPLPQPPASRPKSPSAAAVPEEGALKRLKSRRTPWMQYLLGFVVVGGVLGTGGYYYAQAVKPSPKVTKKAKPAAAPAEKIVSAQPSPTRGKPLTLAMVPSGAHVVISVRPAELWQKNGNTEELRACLGPFASWVEKILTQRCLMEPHRIERAQISFLPNAKGTLPDISVVVHTVEDTPKSELLSKFNGELMNDVGRPYYVGPDYAYLILDPRTFAICPPKLASEMVQAVDGTSVSSDSILAMLEHTDDQRLFSIVFEPLTLNPASDMIGLQDPGLKKLLATAVDWIGDEVDAAVWSFHLTDQKFFSEIVLHNHRGLGTPTKLRKSIEKKLDSTPVDILETVKQMHPKEMGRRKVVGRFPAMSKVFAMSTDVAVENGLVRMRTTLPERAASNLALGTLLAWDHWMSPDFGKKAPTTGPSSGPRTDLPKTFAERLQRKIDVDFRNEFLYAAIDYIGDETGTKFKIEGNDLKMVGVTQNMRQQFKMDQTPATEVLDRMLTKLGLVIVVDEEARLVIVTSEKAAEEKKLKPFKLK